MLAALADRLRAANRRVLFVVGKGGVGKTTTACAIALHLADSGRSTHLLSTDPAHSVGDVFGLGLSGEPLPSPCTPDLVVEELDARAHARAWIDRVIGPVAELVGRGTYLDEADARVLADLSLPGVDEVMGAIRLVELADGRVERIVVDTAPTGHTLRLLDAGDLIAGWIAALDAMAAKARAVGSALVGAAVTVPGEEVVAELRQAVARFRHEVLARAGFVVVTRPGEVVRAETERLLEQLRGRNLGVDAVLVTGGEPTFTGEILPVPLMEDVRGCDGVRQWGVAPDAGEAGRLEGVPRSHRDPVLPRGRETPAEAALLHGPQSLYLFAGKGGVGKSTCAAAFALGLARARPVTLLSTDPAGSLADVLAMPVSEDGARIGNVVARQVDAAAELDRVQAGYRAQVAEAFAAIGFATAAALDRAVVEALWGMAPPGMDELIATVRMARALEAGATLVIDPAPTGHFLRLLEMPRVALDWTHALMRLILKYRLTAELDSVARELLEFARDLKDFLARLTDESRTAAFVVTLDEPVVTAESRRLAAALGAAGVPLAGIVLNRADAGSSRGDGGHASRDASPAAAPRPPVFLAPLEPSPLLGAEALRAFLARWEVAS